MVSCSKHRSKIQMLFIHLTQRAAGRSRHCGRKQEQGARLRQGAGAGAPGVRARERFRRKRGAGAHRLPACGKPGNVCRLDELMIVLQCRPESARSYRWRPASVLFAPQQAAPLQPTLFTLAVACDGLVGASCPVAGAAGVAGTVPARASTWLEEPPLCCCLCAPASTLVTAPSGPWILILYLLPQSPRCLSSLSWKPITTSRADRAARLHIKSRQSRASVERHQSVIIPHNIPGSHRWADCKNDTPHQHTTPTHHTDTPHRHSSPTSLRVLCSPPTSAVH